MGFPESVLTSDERVDMHLRPHFKAVVRPVVVLVVVVAALIVAWILLPAAGWSTAGLLLLGAIALILICWLVVWPWSAWRSTHYVFTNERVIMREGVLSRHGRDIPLSRINDISFQHSFFERLLGCGTLTIESAGERGQVILDDIPHVERVQTRLYELTEAEHESHTFDDADRDAIIDQVRRSRDDTPQPRERRGRLRR